MQSLNERKEYVLNKIISQHISPSNLTVSGTVKSKLLVALIIPLAMVAQFTIPPNTFTKIDFTCESEIINVSRTYSFQR